MDGLAVIHVELLLVKVMGQIWIKTNKLQVRGGLDTVCVFTKVLL